MPPTEPAGPACEETRIKIVSHSDLFYWWPVWAVGFLMAALTYQHGHRVAFVPAGTVAELRAVREHGYGGKVALTAHHAHDAEALKAAGADLVLLPFTDAAEVLITSGRSISLA
jgi:hypothetical protein